MAKQTGLGNQFYLGGFDLSGDVGAIGGISSPRGMVDVTGINVSANDRLLTHSDGQIEFNSFFNDAALAEHAALSGLPTTDRIATYTTGSTLGDPACGLVGKQINYDGSRTADGGLNFSVSFQGNGIPLEWGNSYTAGKVTHSSATNVTSIDLGATSTTAGAQAYLQVFSLSSGNAVVKVQDSADNSSFADQITFTSTTGQTAERIADTGTYRRYIRVASTGTFSNLVFSVIVRRGNASDI